MSVQVIRTGSRTLSSTTGDLWISTKPIFGKILKVETITATAMGLKVFTTEADGTTAAEYVLGGATSTVAATNNRFYPVAEECDSAGAAYSQGSNKTASRGWFIADGKVAIQMLNGTSNYSWAANIYYEA